MDSNTDNIRYSVLKMGGSHIYFDNVMLNGSQYQHGFWEGIECVEAALENKCNSNVLRKNRSSTKLLF